MLDSVRPHRWQPTRLPRPWDSPGKNTGVGCHFLLQCVKVKLPSHVRLLATPWTAVPGSSIHGIFQARVLEWGQLQYTFKIFLNVKVSSDGRRPRFDTWVGKILWRIIWTEEPGGLQSIGSKRVGHDWATQIFSSFTTILSTGLWKYKIHFLQNDRSHE